MFELVDSIGAGRYFWESLLRVRRPPFDCGFSNVSATLLNKDKGLALILAPSGTTPGEDRCMFVQLRDVTGDEVLIDVTLDDDLKYLRGEALGQSADELAASETLAMYAPDLDGEWEIVESGEMTVEEEHA